MYVCMYYINVSSEEVVFIAIEFAYFSLTESVQSINNYRMFTTSS